MIRPEDIRVGFALETHPGQLRPHNEDALGADPARIARAVVRDGLAIVVVGLIPGLFVAFAAGRYMSSLLFGVQPTDPTTIGVTVAACVTVSLCGALLPAIRAVRVSPMSVLRSE